VGPVPGVLAGAPSGFTTKAALSFSLGDIVSGLGAGCQSSTASSGIDQIDE
jgi:hypothetical protein